MMKEHEVRDLADMVPQPILGPVGFLSSEVRARADHDGEDVFYVTVHFSPGADVATGKIHIDAGEAMFEALIEHGERRFANLKYDCPATQVDRSEAGIE